MSGLHELAVEIGNEVNEFARRIKGGKHKINEMKTQFDHQLKPSLEIEAGENKSALEANLERLHKDLLESASAAARNTCEPHLMKALGEVRAAAQRMRDERMEILGEYRSRLDECEVLCSRTSMLEAFISTWNKRLAEGKQLSELPGVIKNLSEEMARFYSTPVHQLLEQEFAETPDTTSHLAIDVSKANVSTSAMDEPLLTPPLAAVSLTTKAMHPCVVDETMSNATIVGSAERRVGSGPEPSIPLDEGGGGNLDGQNTTNGLTDNLHSLNTVLEQPRPTSAHGDVNEGTPINADISLPGYDTQTLRSFA